MEDLHFISTEVLLDELFSRYEQCVFMGTKAQKDNEISKRKYKGATSTCLGLCILLQKFISEEWKKQQKDLPVEDA